MYTCISTQEPDPIFALNEMYLDDTRADKINLGVGVFKDRKNQTPIFHAVSNAEQLLITNQSSKAYTGLAGNLAFNHRLRDLVFTYPSVKQKTAVVQATGGSGALRILADYIYQVNPQATVWISEPSYPNHRLILEGAGLRVQSYTYLDSAGHTVDTLRIFDSLNDAKAGDVVLLQGCCHNPSGADPSPDQWLDIADYLTEHDLVPFVDVAYHGLGRSLSEDLVGLNLLSQLKECFVAYSCSKNFGLYADRVGAAFIVCQTADRVKNVERMLANLCLKTYAMPPNHGALIVSNILSDKALKVLWIDELDTMKATICDNRHRLHKALQTNGCDLDMKYLLKQQGMFSCLPLSEGKIRTLRKQNGIYIVKGGRINFAALNHDNVDSVSCCLIPHLKNH
ncbi:Aspartate aminotransferase [Moritella viscosa]|uniref:aromatic amino acid transaminase n=1 Tax=Moritella viscosa TaxID=80854 RepID=UPI00091AD992|nr:aromatic amino acid transaminase [Moritella viscosa]SGZ09371.1 Aspartate aminotransferase [Moritella viscosa]